MENMYDIETIKKWSKDEVLDFIRDSLKFSDIDYDRLRYVDPEKLKKEHKRFNMSGYEIETGECTLHNQEILNTFAYLGIYDYTDYLFLDFYKGTPALYLRYWNSDINNEYDFDGLSTSNIIYEIFKLTILNDGNLSKRRRW